MPTGTVVSRGYLVPGSVDGVRGRVLTTFARSAYVTVVGRAGHVKIAAPARGDLVLDAFAPCLRLVATAAAPDDRPAVAP